MTLLKRILPSGSAAAAAVTLVASIAGRRASGAYAAPLNATSHTAVGLAALAAIYPALALGLAVSWKR